MSSAAQLPPPPARPTFRGKLHLLAFFATIPVVAWLHHAAPTTAAPFALLYGLGLLCLFGVSAIYHGRHWSPRGYARMRKLDHLTIFLFIAASYTPIGLYGVGGSTGRALVLGNWLFALAGGLRIFLWPSAPRALRAGIYVAMGWTGVFAVAPLARHLGWLPATMLVVGGLLYSLGAVIYARRRPDPVPHIFGYHEVFHAFVVAACGLLFVCIRTCLAAAA